MSSASLVVSILLFIGLTVGGLLMAWGYAGKSRPITSRAEAPIPPPRAPSPIEPSPIVVSSAPAAPPVTPVMGTKFCRFCGVKIPSDSKFCEECGNKVV